MHVITKPETQYWARELVEKRAMALVLKWVSASISGLPTSYRRFPASQKGL